MGNDDAVEPDAPNDGKHAAAVSQDEPLAPIGQLSRTVRDDVSRLRNHLRAIRTPYTAFGLLILLVAAGLGVVGTLVGGFHDWYMHAAMHGVLLSLVLLYFRAGLRRRRLRQAGYAVVTAVMFLFFAWILRDLVPARLEITGDRTRPDGVVVPDVVLRPDAPLLEVVAVLLLVCAGWLLLHWVVLSRRHQA